MAHAAEVGAAGPVLDALLGVTTNVHVGDEEARTARVPLADRDVPARVERHPALGADPEARDRAGTTVRSDDPEVAAALQPAFDRRA